jgi:HprK-related kinase A
LNTCIYQQGQLMLLLHAAVVERGGKALLMVGDSGSGKSTLCAALTLSGWRLLSDELAMISTEDGTLSATARPIILKNESIELIRHLSEGAVFGPLAHSTIKGTVAHLRPPRESVRLMDCPATPWGVLFVDYRAGAATDLRSLSPGRTLLRLAKASFNFGILGQRAFVTLTDALDRCDLFELTYSDLADALSLIERQFPACATEVQAITA